MASNLEMEYQVFLCIFPMNFAMAKLGLKEMGKFLWKGRKKRLPSWLSQFTFAKLRTANKTDLFTYLPKGIFPFPSNHRQPQLSSNEKCKKKPGNMKSGLDAKPLFLQVDMLSCKFTYISLFFFGQPVFRFITSIFLKSNNSRFKKEKMDFLKSRVYCILYIF